MSWLIRIALLFLALAWAWLDVAEMRGLALFAAPAASSVDRHARLAEAVQVDSANGRAWLQLAQSHLGNGNLAEAQRAAEQAMLTLGRYQPHQLRGQILYGRSLEDAAIRFTALEQFDRLTAVVPDDLLTLTRAARVALLNREVARARRYVERADRVEIHPSDARPQSRDLLLVRLQLAQAEGDWAEAGRLARVGVLLEPESVEFVTAWADALRSGAANGAEAAAFARRQWSPGVDLSRTLRLAPLALAGGDLGLAARMVIQATLASGLESETDPGAVDNVALLWTDFLEACRASGRTVHLLTVFAAPEIQSLPAAWPDVHRRCFEELGEPSIRHLMAQGDEHAIRTAARILAARATNPAALSDSEARLLLDLGERLLTLTTSREDQALTLETLDLLFTAARLSGADRGRLWSQMQNLAIRRPMSFFLTPPHDAQLITLLERWGDAMQRRVWQDRDLLEIYDQLLISTAAEALPLRERRFLTRLFRLIGVRNVYGPSPSQTLLDLQQSFNDVLEQ